MILKLKGGGLCPLFKIAVNPPGVPALSTEGPPLSLISILSPCPENFNFPPSTHYFVVCGPLTSLAGFWSRTCSRETGDVCLIFGKVYTLYHPKVYSFKLQTLLNYKTFIEV